MNTKKILPYTTKPSIHGCLKFRSCHHFLLFFINSDIAFCKEARILFFIYYVLPLVLYNTGLRIASMFINRRCKWQIFIIDLNTGFGLSQVEAEALYAGITLFNSDYYDGSRGPGQKTKTVVALEEQASKPIFYCRAERRNKGLLPCDEPIEQVGVRNCSESCGVRAINCKMQNIKREWGWALLRYPLQIHW